LDPLGITYDRPVADAASEPKGMLELGVLAYRERQYERAIRELTALLEVNDHAFSRTVSRFFLAMAHQRLGQAAKARIQLQSGQKELERLVSQHGWTEAIKGELMSFGWTEGLIATLVSHEAEALILHDPIFPVDPFAP
jgi:hypothetical protein